MVLPTRNVACRRRMKAVDSGTAPELLYKLVEVRQDHRNDLQVVFCCVRIRFMDPFEHTYLRQPIESGLNLPSWHLRENFHSLILDRESTSISVPCYVDALQCFLLSQSAHLRQPYLNHKNERVTHLIAPSPPMEFSVTSIDDMEVVDVAPPATPDSIPAYDDAVASAWETLTSLVPLLKVLPALSVQQNEYVLNGKVSKESWNQFQSFAKLVKEFCLSDAEWDPEPRVASLTYLRLAQLQGSLPFFPSLHRLQIVNANSSLSHSFLLLVPSLEYLKISGIPPSHAHLVGSFLTTLSDEEGLSLKSLVLGPNLFTSESLRSIPQFKDLLSLELNCVVSWWDNQLLESISTLPNLLELVIDAGDAQYIAPPPPSHSLWDTNGTTKENDTRYEESPDFASLSSSSADLRAMPPCFPLPGEPMSIPSYDSRPQTPCERYDMPLPSSIFPASGCIPVPYDSRPQTPCHITRGLQPWEYMSDRTVSRPVTPSCLSATSPLRSATPLSRPVTPLPRPARPSSPITDAIPATSASSSAFQLSRVEIAGFKTLRTLGITGPTTLIHQVLSRITSLDLDAVTLVPKVIHRSQALLPGTLPIKPASPEPAAAKLAAYDDDFWGEPCPSVSGKGKKKRPSDLGGKEWHKTPAQVEKPQIKPTPITAQLRHFADPTDGGLLVLTSRLASQWANSIRVIDMKPHQWVEKEQADAAKAARVEKEKADVAEAARIAREAEAAAEKEKAAQDEVWRRRQKQEEKAAQEEERRMKKEEDRAAQEEELRRIEEEEKERMRIEEEEKERMRIEEEEKERRRIEEEEKERRRIEEEEKERRRIEEYRTAQEEAWRRKGGGEKAAQEDERRRKEEEEDERRRIEDERRRIEDERRRIEDERRRIEEDRTTQEEERRRKEEEHRAAQDEAKKRKEEDDARAAELFWFDTGADVAQASILGGGGGLSPSSSPTPACGRTTSVESDLGWGGTATTKEGKKPGATKPAAMAPAATTSSKISSFGWDLSFWNAPSAVFPEPTSSMFPEPTSSMFPELTSSILCIAACKILEVLDLRGWSFDPSLDKTISDLAPSWPKLTYLHFSVDQTNGGVTIPTLRVLGLSCPLLTTLETSIFLDNIPPIDFAKGYALSHPLKILSTGNNGSVQNSRELLLVARHINILFPHVKIATHKGHNAEEWLRIGELVEVFQDVRKDDRDRDA